MIAIQDHGDENSNIEIVATGPINPFEENADQSNCFRPFQEISLHEKNVPLSGAPLNKLDPHQRPRGNNKAEKKCDVPLSSQFPDKNNSPVSIHEFLPEDDECAPDGLNIELQDATIGLDRIESFRTEMSESEPEIDASSKPNALVAIRPISLSRPRQRLPTIYEVESIDSADYLVLEDNSLSQYEFDAEAMHMPHIEQEPIHKDYYPTPNQSDPNSNNNNNQDGQSSNPGTQSPSTNADMVASSPGKLSPNVEEVRTAAPSPLHGDLQNTRIISEKALVKAKIDSDHQTQQLNEQLSMTQQYTNEILSMRKAQTKLKADLERQKREMAVQKQELQEDFVKLIQSKQELNAAKSQIFKEEMEVERIRGKHKKQMQLLEEEKEKMHAAMEKTADETANAKETTRKVISDLHEYKNRVRSEMQAEVEKEKEAIAKLKSDHKHHIDTLLEEKENIRAQLEKEQQAMEESRCLLEKSLESLEEAKKNMENELMLQIDSVSLVTKECKSELQKELAKARFSKTMLKMEVLKGHAKESMKCMSLDAIANAGEFSKVAFQALVEPFNDDVLIQTAGGGKKIKKSKAETQKS